MFSPNECSTARAMRRISERFQWIDKEWSGSSSAWTIPHSLSSTDQLSAFFCESVYLALTTTELELLVRSALQVAHYAGRLESMPNSLGGCLISDGKSAVRDRLEGVVLRGKPLNADGVVPVTHKAKD